MTNKIRVAHVVDTFGVGGRETVILDLCNKLNDKLFDIFLIVLTRDNLGSLKFIKPNVTCYFLDMSEKDLRSFKLFYHGIPQLVRLLKIIKPDIIHSHLFFLRFLLVSVSLRLVSFNIVHYRTVHTSGLFYEKQASITDKVRLLTERFSTKLNETYLISISSIVHTNNIKYFGRFSKKIKLINNGVDLSIFNINETKTSKRCWGFSDSDIVATYVARLDEGKNHKFLLGIWSEVIKMCPRAVLCFAGDGALRNDLELMVEIKSLQSNIRFLGSISNVPELLAISSLAVFPSLFEGFSLVMLEKFAMGLPVVASDIDAFREIGEDGKNCFLVSTNDPQNFAKRIIELCNNEELRCEIGRKAKESAELFTVEKFIALHEEYYLDCLNK